MGEGGWGGGGGWAVSNKRSRLGPDWPNLHKRMKKIGEKNTEFMQHS